VKIQTTNAHRITWMSGISTTSSTTRIFGAQDKQLRWLPKRNY